MTATTTPQAADDREPRPLSAAPEIEQWRGVSAEGNDDISTRFSASSTRASVWMSSADKVSSSTSTAGLASTARARASRCR